jgi:hypothetical protein
MPPAVIALLSAAPDIRTEVMSPFFRKIHLGDGRALHHFTAADEGDEWHDHPWSFTSKVLAGGYVEQIVYPDSACAHWMRRLPGSTHTVSATHIHRITRLLADDCWTLVTAGPVERDVRFYRFRDGQLQSRLWNEGWPA